MCHHHLFTIIKYVLSIREQIFHATTEIFLNLPFLSPRFKPMDNGKGVSVGRCSEPQIALPQPCGLGQPEQGTWVVALRTPLPAGPARGDPSNPLICLGKFAQASL